MSALLRLSMSPLALARFVDRTNTPEARRSQLPFASPATWHTADCLGLWVKRAIDLTAASVGLIVLAPLLLSIAVLIRLDSPGPALLTARCGAGTRDSHSGC